MVQFIVIVESQQYIGGLAYKVSTSISNRLESYKSLPSVAFGHFLHSPTSKQVGLWHFSALLIRDCCCI